MESGIFSGLKKIDDALSKCLNKLKSNISIIGEKSPSDITYDGKYKLVENKVWTTGFYPGMLWIAYLLSHDEEFLKAGKEQTASFKNRCENDVEMEKHDIGFLYSLSAVADYECTGDGDAMALAKDAAYKMSELYRKSVKLKN